MDSKVRGRRSAADAERTRTAILTVAMRLFAERGFEAVSLRDIAAAAGVTHGLIRHHFGTKDDVWRAVRERADAVYLAAMRPAIERAAERAGPVAALTTIARTLAETTARHPEIIRLLIGESTRGGPRLREILRSMAPLRAALDPIVARLRAGGGLAALDENVFFLVLMLAGVAPFGLTALTAEVAGPALLTPAGAGEHAEGFVRALLGIDRYIP